MRHASRTTAKAGSTRAKRRSQRLSLRYPLVAYSVSETTGKMRFREGTHTVKVSAHGGLIPLNAAVGFGETFILKHSSRLEEHPCKVVYLGSDSKTGKGLVGFEFIYGQPDFWHIYFPPTNGKPLPSASRNNGNSGGSFYAHD